MEFQGFSMMETKKKSKVKRDRPKQHLHCYIVKSNLGNFMAFSFRDALDIAKKLFAVKGSWALIET